MFQGREDVEKILSALSKHLDEMKVSVPELLICGGSALNITGFVNRTTKDVDIVAFVNRTADGRVNLTRAEPFPDALQEAAKKVARDFNLSEDWLNTGPTSAVDLGLPEAIMERVVTRSFGKSLTVHFLGRYDQIHFKLYAAADRGEGKHYDDLLALQPTAQELEHAVRWSMTHDPSEGYRESVIGLLTHMGFKDVAERL